MQFWGVVVLLIGVGSIDVLFLWLKYNGLVLLYCSLGVLSQ